MRRPRSATKRRRMRQRHSACAPLANEFFRESGLVLAGPIASVLAERDERARNALTFENGVSKRLEGVDKFAMGGKR